MKSSLILGKPYGEYKETQMMESKETSHHRFVMKAKERVDIFRVWFLFGLL